MFYASSSGSSPNLITLLDTGLVDVNQKASNGKTAISKSRCYKNDVILKAGPAKASICSKQVRTVYFYISYVHTLTLVFCCPNCSDLLWEQIVLVINKFEAEVREFLRSLEQFI
mgnify:CR=1 FL=1